MAVLPRQPACDVALDPIRNAHLSALLDLLPALAQAGQIHLALSRHGSLLKLGDAHARHIVRLGYDPHLGLLHSSACVRLQRKQLPF